MNSYFFVPASRLHKIEDIQNLEPNNIIIDFEDAILSSDMETYFKKLESIKDIALNWFRIPLRSDFNEDINLKYIDEFISIGVNSIVLPKLKSIAELVQIVEKYKRIRIIVLIEHPRLLIELRNSYLKHLDVFQAIVGIGLGSHDLMTFMNAKHIEEQLDYPRREVLYLAKAYGIEAIDIACMEISNKETFIKEFVYGQDSGFDAKFLIHPIQLKWFDNQIKLDPTSLVWAKNIMKYLPDNYNGEDISPFVLDGEVIEKPHALKALQIMKKHNYGK